MPTVPPRSGAISADDLHNQRGTPGTAGSTPVELGWTATGDVATLIGNKSAASTTTSFADFYSQLWSSSGISTTNVTTAGNPYYTYTFVTANNNGSAYTDVSSGTNRMIGTAISTDGLNCASNIIGNLQTHPWSTGAPPALRIQGTLNQPSLGGTSYFIIRAYENGYAFLSRSIWDEYLIITMTGNRSHNVDITVCPQLGTNASTRSFFMLDLEVHTTSTSLTQTGYFTNPRVSYGLGGESTNTKLALCSYLDNPGNGKWPLVSDANLYNYGNGTQSAPYFSEWNYPDDTGLQATYDDFNLNFRVLESGTCYYSIRLIWSTVQVAFIRISKNGSQQNATNANASTTGSFTVAQGDIITVTLDTGYSQIGYSRTARLESLYVV